MHNSADLLSRININTLYLILNQSFRRLGLLHKIFKTRIIFLKCRSSKIKVRIMNCLGVRTTNCIHHPHSRSFMAWSRDFIGFAKFCDSLEYRGRDKSDVTRYENDRNEQRKSPIFNSCNHGRRQGAVPPLLDIHTWYRIVDRDLIVLFFGLFRCPPLEEVY